MLAASRRFLSTRRHSVRENNDQHALRTTKKKKIALIVGYRGTSFAGSFRNPTNQTSTIEEEVEAALYQCNLVLEANRNDPKKMQLSRSSRTDKGVHSACSMITAKLDLPSLGWEPLHTMDASLRKQAESTLLDETLITPVNKALHPDIRVLTAFRAAKGFNPRFHCTVRDYEYVLPLRMLGDRARAVSVPQINQLLDVFSGSSRYHNYTKQRLLDARAAASTPTTTARTTCKDEDMKVTAEHENGDDDEEEGNDDDDDDTGDDDEEEEFESVDARPTYKSISFGFDYRQETGTLAAIAKERWRQLGKNPDLNRTMLHCSCSLGELNGDPSLIFRIKGRSFLYNQIRKMIGTVLLEQLGYAQPGYVQLALKSALPFPTPLVPGMFLLLSDSEWRLSSDERISFEKESQDFRQQFLYPHLNWLAGQHSVKEEWGNFFKVLDRVRLLDHGLDHQQLLGATRRVEVPYPRYSTPLAAVSS